MVEEVVDSVEEVLPEVEEVDLEVVDVAAVSGAEEDHFRYSMCTINLHYAFHCWLLLTMRIRRFYCERESVFFLDWCHLFTC